jgi:hypothetical protein
MADMIEFALTDLIRDLDNLEYFRAKALDSVNDSGPSSQASQGERDELLDKLESMRKHCAALKLVASESKVIGLGNRMIGLVRSPSCAHEIILAGIEEIQQSITHELAARKFAFIAPGGSEFFEQHDLFGEGVSAAFPSAQEDIKEAGNCLAADLNTASVFHLMRAVEIGLRALARHVRVPAKGQLEYAQWNQIIEQIESKVRIVRQQPAGKKKSESLEFYHGVLGEFNAFKDVWRNNVMHSRRHYNHPEARGAYLHVREFMQRLATRVKEVN